MKRSNYFRFVTCFFVAKLALVGLGFPAVGEAQPSYGYADTWVEISDLSGDTVSLINSCEYRMRYTFKAPFASNPSVFEYRLEALSTVFVTPFQNNVRFSVAGVPEFSLKYEVTGPDELAPENLPPSINAFTYEDLFTGSGESSPVSVRFQQTIELTGADGKLHLVVERATDDANALPGFGVGKIIPVTHSFPLDPTNFTLLARCKKDTRASDLARIALLKESYGFRQTRGTYYEVWQNLQYKWFVSPVLNNAWFYITPHGDVYRWAKQSSMIGDELIVRLSPEIYHTLENLVVE